VLLSKMDDKRITRAACSPVRLPLCALGTVRSTSVAQSAGTKPGSH
jgi:hypothetical protein